MTAPTLLLAMAAPAGYVQQENPLCPEERGQIRKEHGLAVLWEANVHCRERMRFNDGKLVSWPVDKNGKVQPRVCMAAIAENARALKLLAEWWCPRQSKPCSPSVGHLRREAGVR